LRQTWRQNDAADSGVNGPRQWQAAFHRDTLQSAVSKTRNLVEGILTLVIGLALVAMVIAGVLEEILQPTRRSYGLVEVLIGLFIVGAAGFIGVAFTLDGWRQTLSGLRQVRPPTPR
jgi:hypothetical protein